MLAKTKALILATVFMHPDISLILLGSSTEYSKNAKIQQNTPKYKKSEIQDVNCKDMIVKYTSSPTHIYLWAKR